MNPTSERPAVGIFPSHASRDNYLIIVKLMVIAVDGMLLRLKIHAVRKTDQGFLLFACNQDGDLVFCADGGTAGATGSAFRIVYCMYHLPGPA